MISLNRPPRYPGKEPDNTTLQTSWRKKADTYAEYCLVMFRPEPDHYDASHINIFRYDWDTLQQWIQSCQAENSLMSQLRLKTMETHLHGINTPFSNKVIISKYRGRNRRLWTDEDHVNFNIQERFMTAKSTIHDGSALSDAVFEKEHSVLSEHAMKSIRNQLHYCNHQSTKINHLFAEMDQRMKQTNSHQQTNHDRSINTDPKQQQKHDILFSENNNHNPCSIQQVYDKIATWTELPIKNLKRKLDSNINYDLLYNKTTLNDPDDIQKQILTQCQNIFSASVGGFWNEFTPTQHQPVLITGDPGAGKSALIHMIKKLAFEQFDKQVISLSFNGIAAVNIDGDTISGAGQLNFHKSDTVSGAGHEDNITVLSPVQGTKRLQDLQDSFNMQLCIALIIDEISTVSPVVLASLSERCQQVTGRYDLAFGGIPVFFFGDFSQLPPVQGSSLTKGLIDLEQWIHADLIAHWKRLTPEPSSQPQIKTKNLAVETSSGGKVDKSKASKYATNSLFRKGCEIFKSCRWMKLIHQHRTKDPAHKKKLLHMAEGNKITPAFMQQYKRLSKDDLNGTDQLEWLKTPILVATNRERHNLIGPQCERFAQATGTRVIRWPSKKQKWEQRPHSDYMEDVMKDPCFYEYFVAGAEGYITDNINKKLGLVNGTRIQYHSIVPSSPEQAQFIQDQLASTTTNTVISLSEPPASVNVRLIDIEAKNDGQYINRWESVTLVRNQIVVPLIPKRSKRQYTRTCIPGDLPRYYPSRVELLSHFPLDMGFAITIHKAQGRTLRRVIIAISDRYKNNLQMSYAALYVALSRVEYMDDIRLLVNGDNDDLVLALDYLNYLAPAPDIRAFFLGFKKTPGSGITWRLYPNTKALHVQMFTPEVNNAGISGNNTF